MILLYAWLVVYVNKGLPFAQKLLLKTLKSLISCIWLALLHLLSGICFLYQLPPPFLCTGFDAISSRMDEVLSVNPFADVFFFGDCNNLYHKDWLTFSGWAGRSDRSQTTWVRWLNFYLDSWLWLSQFCSLDFLLFSHPSICSAGHFLIIFVVSVSTNFSLNSSGDASFHCTTNDFFCWLG